MVSASDRRKLLIAVILLVVAVALFLLWGLGNNWEYALRLRAGKVLAMLLMSGAVAYSTVTFQTLTSNRILTPSIMGFESVYLLIQTIIVFFQGAESIKLLNGLPNFLISVAGMVLFALVIYLLIYKRGGNDLYLLLLVGVVLGTLLSSLSSFMQLVIDPSNYFILQGKMFASFNRINHDFLLIATITMVVTLSVSMPASKYLDVLALGRDHAINLGVNYNSSVRFFLLIIAVLTSVSVALVGPITFLGLLVANVTYELFNTYKHSFLIPACAVVAGITLVGGQWLMERLFKFSTPISTIINLVGGIYFLYLLLRVRKK